MAKPTPEQIAAKQAARAAKKLNNAAQKKRKDWLKAHGKPAAQVDALKFADEQSALEAVLSLNSVTLDQYEEAVG